MRLLGNQEFPCNVDTFCLYGLDFILEDDRIDNDSVSDDIYGIRAENAGRNCMKNESISVEYQRVACVWTALEARYNLVIRGQYIDYFAFALVSPLEAENDVYFLHNMPVFLKI